MNKLSEIQQALKAPKGQTNKFGNYKYRSCEDILEAVKPLLGDMTLIISDEIVLIGDRYYVKATAHLCGTTLTATAYAREADQKKGMDVAQITGAASSYARKYALNGLFCIDDTKDPDTGKPDDAAPEPPKVKERTIRNNKEIAVFDAVYEKLVKMAPDDKFPSIKGLENIIWPLRESWPDNMEKVDDIIKWLKDNNKIEGLWV